jgi:hypothetical protein
MKKYLVVSSLLFAVFALPVGLRADQSYNVNLTAGDDTVAGTIVTDGDLGALNTVEIDSFSFGVTRTISSGSGRGGSAKEQGSTADIDVTGNALTATSVGLFFNFYSTAPSALNFLDANDAFLLCLFTDEGCGPAGSGAVLTLGDTTFTETGLTGDQLLATTASATVPEPGTCGFLPIGFAGLALLLRKRSVRGIPFLPWRSVG